MNETIERLTAIDLMSGDPVAYLRGDQSVGEAARFLLERGMTGAPVEDERGSPIGVLTLTDIARLGGRTLRAKDDEACAVEEWFDELGERQGLGSIPSRAFRKLQVREAMSSGLRTVRLDQPLAEVLDALLEGPYRRVFVRDPGGTLVGVVGLVDVVRAVRNGLR